MSQENMGALAGKIYDLVKGLKTEEISKVLDAVATLCGSMQPRAEKKQTQADTTGGAVVVDKMTAAQYFAHKAPKGKKEELAVAARFRELQKNEQMHSKEDFAAFFTEARRNFDAEKFSRDMGNSKDSGLFVKKGGAKTHQHQLSYSGQNFIDALPDRAKAKAAKTKVRKPNKKKSVKK